MEDLCTACLCTGRNLYFIGETGFYDLYSQILNEIQVYDLSQVCIRLCWECRAILRRLESFKRQVKKSYTQLLQYVNQNTSKCSISKLSRIRTEHVYSFSYPLDEIKSEIEETATVEDVKCEMEEHCEPEAFVNYLNLEKLKKRDVLKKISKPTKRKSKKKLKKKSSIKKIKVKKKEDKQDVQMDHSDGVSDVDSLHYSEENDKELVVKEEYNCKQCDNKFEGREEMENHVRTHNQLRTQNKVTEKTVPKDASERPQCVECGKIFSSRKTYRYHLNVLHKGQNRYPCPRCGKVYQWKSNLGRHMRSHKARDSGELYCVTCDKRFASVATYRQHLRISRRHVAETDYSFTCNECGKKFVNKTRLRDHIDWEHLKKIKFKCQLCNKPFKCHTSLYVHTQNVHRNKEKKDNLCHVCGKSYQNSAKLKYHIVAMHTSETPHRCPQCGAAFGWYSSLYRHLREVHYKMKAQAKKPRKVGKAGVEFPPLPSQVLPLQTGPS